MKHARIVCCVEGCSRSSRNTAGYTEWLCRRHWHCTDLALRVKFNLARREWRRHRNKNIDPVLRNRLLIALGNAWNMLVSDAQIKTAMNVEGTRSRRGSKRLRYRQDPLDVADATNIAYGDGS